MVSDEYNVKMAEEGGLEELVCFGLSDIAKLIHQA